MSTMYRACTRITKKLVARATATMPVVAALILVVSMVGVTPLGGIKQALAASTATQTDWSGGQGADPATQWNAQDNIETTVANQATVLGSNVANWCDLTTICNTDWTIRKTLTWSPNSNNWSNGKGFVTVPITYDAGMKADFSDLRFVSMDGMTNLEYWIRSKTDGVSAEVLVSINDFWNYRNNNAGILLYFGNASATARSNHDETILITDDFSSGNLDAWDDTDGVTVVNGEAVIENSRLRSDYYYREYTRIYDAKFKIHYDGNLCGVVGIFGEGPIFTTPNETYGDIISGNCHPSNVFGLWAIQGDHGFSYPPSGSHAWHSDEWIYARVIAYATGGNDTYISYDGITYEKQEFAPRDLDDGSGGSLELNNEFGVPNNVTGTMIVDSASARIADVEEPGEPRSPRTTTRDSSIALNEYVGGGTGTLVSAPLSIGSNAYPSVISESHSGGGQVSLQVRTSNYSGMDDASQWERCEYVQSLQSLSGTSCVQSGHTYVQYRVTISSPASLDTTLTEVSITYDSDTVIPAVGPTQLAIKYTANKPALADGAWYAAANYNDGYPYFSWTVAQDDVGGSGIAGYCLYFGNDPGADPATSGGMLTDNTNTPGPCPVRTSTNFFDTHGQGNMYLQGQNNQSLYLRVKAYDRAGNITPTSEGRYIKIDSHRPDGAVVGSGPNGVINSKSFTISYAALEEVFPINDSESGVAGVKYCITNITLGFDCLNSNNNQPGGLWWGASHSSGVLSDTTDVLPVSGSITTGPADFDRITDDGANIVVFSVLDNAGNNSYASPFITYVNIALQAPSTPLNLSVDPAINPENDFSFHWDAPTTYAGASSAISYCWSVNVPINVDATNCTWTDPGDTMLEAGPYATQQGTNTLYLIAKDQAGNFESQNVANVSFIANTSAPGAPQELDVTDISTRATSNWKLAMAWAPPTSGAQNVTLYKILRSSDGANYSQVGSTNNTNLSYIDTGLQQVTYSYKIQACDSAGACSVYSNVASRRPTGRFTTPANLVTQPSESDIGTRKATIKWTTDRESDSRVAIGTSPGHYSHDETGNSTQSAAHTLNLSGLQANTTYYYVAKWTDADGNVGVSTEHSFTTLLAPEVSDVSSTAINVSSGTVNFTVEHAAGIKLYYGETDAFGGLKQLNTSVSKSSYSIPLSELRDGTKYLFKTNGLDADGNEYQGNVFSFTTLARPKITDFKIESIEDEPSSTQKVTWKTNVLTSTELVYGPQGQDQAEQIVSTPTLSHEMTVRDLADDTDYTLIARVRDSVGNIGTSEIQRFHTALDTRAPKVSNVTVEAQIKGSGKEARGQVIVSWHTDEPSTSQVAFGQGATANYGSLTAEDARLTTEHVVVISDLPTSSVYQMQAVSRDKARNTGQSDNQTAIVGRGTDNVFTIIFSALQRIFGIK